MKKRLLDIYSALHKHFGSQSWWPAETPIEVCVGAILTQNTAWTNVEKAIRNLKREGILSEEGIYHADTARLAELIRPSGYYNIKAKRLKNFINFLFSQYDGKLSLLFKNKDIKGLREELLKVNGIGKETADSIILYAGDLPIFVVDAYTKRIFEKCRICKGDIEYDILQSIFMKYLPRDAALYNEYHALIVMLGKHYCKKRPVCNACPLQDRICSFSDCVV